MGEVGQRSLEPNAVEITQGWAGWEEPRCPRSTQAWPGEQWPWAGASGISSHRQEVASGTCSRPDPRDTGDGVGEVRWGPQLGPAPTKLGEEIALGHLGRIVLVQKVASIALLAEPTQPVLAHHRLLPDDVPKRAPHAWPWHTPTVTACLYPTAPAIAAPPALPALRTPPCPSTSQLLSSGHASSFPGCGRDLQHPLGAWGSVSQALPRSGCPGGVQALPSA